MKKNYALSILGSLLAAGTFAQSCSLELVPNGGFESGISLSNFENFPIYQDFANHPSNVTSWHAYKGLPDLCVRGSIKTQEPFTPIPAQGIPLNAYNTFYSNVGAINTHNGSPNNRYIMLQEDEGPNCEGLYTELVIAPDRKKSYTLNAWAINIHDSREQDAYLIFKLHNANPVTGSPSISHTVGTVFVGDANGGSNPWTSISISIPAFSLPVGELKYLTVETKNLNYEFEPSVNLVFIDDISIFDADAVAGGTLTNFGTYTCPGTSVLMSLQGSWGNIQWQRRPCNSGWVNIPGNSNVLLVTTINTSLQYYYRAKLTSCNGVVRYSNSVVIYDKQTCTSIPGACGGGGTGGVGPGKTSDDITEEISANTGINIFPNPTSHSVMIATGSELNNATLQVFDMTGKMVFEKSYETFNNAELNLSDQPKGIYMVKITSPDQVYTEKVIKE